MKRVTSKAGEILLFLFAVVVKNELHVQLGVSLSGNVRSVSVEKHLSAPFRNPASCRIEILSLR